MARKVCIYYLPDAPPNPEHVGRMLAGYGLFDRFDLESDATQDEIDAKVATRYTKRGPDSGKGMLMAKNPRDGVVFDPNNQVWHGPYVVEGEAKPIWFGWFTDSPPGPSEFARSHLFSGHPLVLGDGRMWVIPLARLQPKRRDINAAGEWCLVDTEASQRLFERADRLRGEYWEPVNAARRKLDELSSEAEERNKAPLTPKDIEFFNARVALATDELNKAVSNLNPDVTVEILATNYCVGRVEVAKLGLLEATGDTNNGIMGTHDYAVLHAAVDGSVLHAMLDGEEIHAARAASADEAKKD